jgi:hypothetical protein
MTGGKMRKYMLFIVTFLGSFSILWSIISLPYTQNFEGMVFPPSEWTCYNVDGQEPQWSANTTFNHSQGGSRSVMHLAGGAMPQEEGWLVSPPVVLPSPGGYAMTFWSYNANPELYSNLANSVLISTTFANPTTGNYTCIWSPITVTDRWHPNQVDLSPFQGNTIYIAFRYQGQNIHSWYLDDVTIEENPSIYEFPWSEDFESGVFPPYYWWQYDDDGTGESWQTSWNQNHSEDGAISAVHFSGSSEIDWLIMPQIHIPETGNYSVSFWSYNDNLNQAGGENRVMLSTQSNMPSDADFQEVWYDQVVSGGNWVNHQVDLSTWAGQSIYLAFLYTGDNTHDWYLDDVVISENEGVPGPTLSIVNTPEGLVLHWTEVPWADYYTIYASANPTAPEPWGVFDTTVALELGALGDASYNFFKVTAEVDSSKYVEHIKSLSRKNMTINKKKN